MSNMHYSDELEKKIGDTLTECGIPFERKQRLDFYIPSMRVYIEVKKYHTPRSQAQLESQENIILIQGKLAVEAFCNILTGKIK